MQRVANIIASSAPLMRYAPALDSIQEQIEAGRIEPALDELFEDLLARRAEDPKDWPAYASSCLSHPLRELLHQDPLTCRAFSKPRGYAGDAVMMDYIYGLGEAPQAVREATLLGRAILQYTGARPSALGVRYRRNLIAELIDREAARGARSVLAIAAGHLREADLSAAVQSGGLEEFVAFDQDEASLAVVARDYGNLGIRTVNGSVRQILSGKVTLPQSDFVYAAGLFDYLTGPVAAALARRMFDMTRPGGLMLIPNFLTGVRDTGYMEAFMDWRLIYRTGVDMHALAAELPRNQVADYQVFDDRNGAITYLLVKKKQ